MRAQWHKSHRCNTSHCAAIGQTPRTLLLRCLTFTHSEADQQTNPIKTHKEAACTEWSLTSHSTKQGSTTQTRTRRPQKRTLLDASRLPVVRKAVSNHSGYVMGG